MTGQGCNGVSKKSLTEFWIHPPCDLRQGHCSTQERYVITLSSKQHSYISLSKHSYRIDLSMHHTVDVDFMFGSTYHYELTLMRVVEEIS